MIPAVLGAAGLSLGAIYSIGQLRDSNRYWNDYFKNTGIRAAYPYRAGVYDSLRYGSRAMIFGASYSRFRPVHNHITNYHKNYYFNRRW